MSMVLIIFVVGMGLWMNLDIFKVLYQIVGVFMVVYVMKLGEIIVLDCIVVVVGYGVEVVEKVVKVWNFDVDVVLQVE